MDLLNRSDAAQIVEAPREEACHWLSGSLRAGFDLSGAVLAAEPFRSGRFQAIVSTNFQRSTFDYRVGGVIGQEGAREKLAHLLATLDGRNGGLALVEDDLRRRSDEAILRRNEPSSFIGDRVIHWTDMAAPEDQLAETIAHGASGYPLNAFVVTKSSSELGLVDGGDAPGNLAQEVATNLLAIVVAAFDAESFLIWTTDARSREL